MSIGFSSHTGWFLLPLLSQHGSFVGYLFFNRPVKENIGADDTDTQHWPVDQYCMDQLGEGWRWYAISKERAGEERCIGDFSDFPAFLVDFGVFSVAKWLGL